MKGGGRGSLRFAIAIVGLGATFIGWQWFQLQELQATESKLVAGQQSAQPDFASSEMMKREAMPSLTEEELFQFSDSLKTRLRDYRSERHEKARREMRLFTPEMNSLLSRMSSEQLFSLIAALPTDGESLQEQTADLNILMNFAAMLNPVATLDSIVRLTRERGNVPATAHAASAFRFLFLKDPAELLLWARKNHYPASLGDQLSLWTDAASATVDPTPQSVAKFLAHKRSWWNDPACEIVRKLPTQQARVAFFASLHTVTHGKAEITEPLIRVLSAQIPFAQIANMADSVPPFFPSSPERTTSEMEILPNGSLRYNVAALSGDGTPAQRWAWLTSRPEDRPTGKLLIHLLREWRSSNSAEVDAWVKALPAGPERTEIRAAIAKH